MVLYHLPKTFYFRTQFSKIWLLNMYPSFLFLAARYGFLQNLNHHAPSSSQLLRVRVIVPHDHCTHVYDDKVRSYFSVINNNLLQMCHLNYRFDIYPTHIDVFPPVMTSCVTATKPFSSTTTELECKDSLTQLVPLLNFAILSFD